MARLAGPDSPLPGSEAARRSNLRLRAFRSLSPEGLDRALDRAVAYSLASPAAQRQGRLFSSGGSQPPRIWAVGGDDPENPRPLRFARLSGPERPLPVAGGGPAWGPFGQGPPGPGPALLARGRPGLGPQAQGAERPRVPSPEQPPTFAGLATQVAPLAADPRELGDGPPWTADQLEAAPPGVFAAAGGLDPPVATLAPRPWPLPPRIGQQRYSERFELAYPGVARLLCELPGVVVAGAAAAWPLGDPEGVPPPATFYFLGPPDGDAELWQRLDGVLERLLEGHLGPVPYALEPGRLRLELPQAVAFVLRPFATAAALFESFGVPAAAVAYDGRQALLSRAGAHAHMFRVNTVWPERCGDGTPGELRHFFGRGFALAFPALHGAALRPGPLRLPELDFRLDSAWGRLALGRLLPGTGAAPESLAALCAAPPLETNAARLVAGRTTFVEVGIAAGGVLRACLSSLVADAPAGPAIPQQDLELFLRRASEQSLKAGCLDVGRLCGLFGLSPEEVGLVASAAARARAADPAAELSIAAALRRDCSALLARNASLVPSPWWERGPPARGSGAEWRRPLAGGEPSGAPASPSSRDAGPPARRPQAAGGPLGALGAATGPASALPAAGDSGRSTGDDAGGLAELMAALGEGEGAEEKRTTAESLAVPAPDGPPPPTGPAGEAEKKQPLGGQTELERLLAYLERRESSDTDPPTCALCFEPVAKGSVNSAHLGCGHVLHWAAAGGCGGLVTWSRLNDTCPLCRARFEHAGQDREARPRAVQVSWARPGERG